ncbi:hypothetical protein PHIN3_298 [Sinorhizobium phage phiN3]|uniref:Uncharacterized protein n=1 Tax=Sinorhizobium phage phiN3 TaxID=1647405 RepID=A0A0F6WD12_9CAUD|nr:hypothetical protein AVT40_gp235 [Sinorhizobium phage phiN3]AKF13561.1 hypothetical protein PHIN3_298 [Sinorhizobium phage phiN3]
MTKKNPREDFLQLLEEFINKTSAIDLKTPWQDVEPKWWLKMIELRQEAINAREEFL